MTLELVVFDMAGTTVNDRNAVNDCLRASLADAGLAVTTDAVNGVMGLLKTEALRLLIEQSGQTQLLPCVERIHTDFVGRMNRFYESDPSVFAIPGTLETFQALRRAGVRVALDTGFGRPIVDVILRRLGWRDGETIDGTITSDEVARGRPFPDMIQALMKRFSIGDPRSVAKVGDTPSDLHEGTQAGCSLVIGVTRGSHSREQLTVHPHTHLIDTVADLPPLLRMLKQLPQ